MIDKVNVIHIIVIVKRKGCDAMRDIKEFIPGFFEELENLRETLNRAIELGGIEWDVVKQCYTSEILDEVNGQGLMECMADLQKELEFYHE